ncbi:hypothetical protein [Campylobacter ureolyticus]|uniref:hypothetical protein n=1 Tax=Campylobacter ureolyticus TaxID=827 RepID=UPI0022B4533B|nr:hypothetical protein [Campylobacter ureolyticus]MCZ6110892.1 hypothetical protein [Campylobacter ureolyticus]MDK8323652.1 hypothetical protein [Campylobacter ureolyticus]
MNEKMIDSTTKFVLSVGEWNSQAVMFVCVVIIIIVLLFYTRVFTKNIEKNQDKLIDVINKNSQSNTELSKSIELQNRINLETLNRLDKGINESLKMHEATHNDLNDLKKMISKRFNDE